MSMLSNLSKRFLSQILQEKHNLRKIISTFPYAERITIAIDMHVIQERLIEDVKEFIDENELLKFTGQDKKKLS